MAVKLYDHKSFNVTAQFARMLEVRKVIVYECLELLVNPHIRRAQKVHELINGLQQAGRQLNTLVTFHDCLIESSQDSWTAPGQCPNHRELADQIQLHGNCFCEAIILAYSGTNLCGVILCIKNICILSPFLA